MVIWHRLLLYSSLAFVCQCGPDFHSASAPATDHSSTNQDEQIPSPPQPKISDFICSDLEVSTIIWPQKFTLEHQLQMVVGLNVSGSFEGPDGWQNITNDFDGQGLSLGLLNQTLGTGSLQPLLLSYMQNQPTKWLEHFSPQRAQSISAMLRKWNTASARSKIQTVESKNNNSSPLDEDWDEPNPSGVILFGVKEDESVLWARSNLYNSNGKFVAEWKRELQAMARSEAYINIQLAAAQSLYDRAQLYMQRTNMNELRAFAFYFDIVVQNGGLRDAEIDELLEFQKNNQQASVSDQLFKLLEIRLRRVKSQWREDVRLRKTSIINGQGVVHGSQRNYAKEFCLQPELWSASADDLIALP